MTLPLARNTTSIHRRYIYDTYRGTCMHTRDATRIVRLLAPLLEYCMRFLAAARNLRKDREAEQSFASSSMHRPTNTPFQYISPLFLRQRLIFPSALSSRLVRIVRTLLGKHSQFPDGDNDKRGRNSGGQHRFVFLWFSVFFGEGESFFRGLRSDFEAAKTMVNLAII